MASGAASRRRFGLMWAVLGFLVVASAWIVSLPITQQRQFMREDGPVESVSALGYFFCVGLILFFNGVGYVRRFPFLITFIALLGMREMDFDSRFTTIGIFQTWFFASPDVPIFEKAIGLAAVVLCVWVVIVVFRRHILPAFREPIGGLRRYPEAFAAGLLMAASSMMDGVTRNLRGVGILLGPWADNAFGRIEEVIELGIPVLLLLAVIAHGRTLARSAQPETTS